MSKVSDNYCTPKWFVDLVDEALDPIELDPCWNKDSHVRADFLMTEEETKLDSCGNLQMPSYIMPGRNVFMNPPYSRPWCEKFVKWFISYFSKSHYLCLPFRGIVLVNSATETRWYQNLLNTCDAACFLKKRINFEFDRKETNNSRYGQTVFYFECQGYGEMAKFYGVFDSYGTIFKGRYGDLS